MSIAYPACATCAFHTRLPGSRFLLCTLPSECAPVLPNIDPDDDWRDREDRLQAYIGTNCDVMRKMGGSCGPRGAMWTPIEGDQA